MLYYTRLHAVYDILCTISTKYSICLHGAGRDQSRETTSAHAHVEFAFTACTGLPLIRTDARPADTFCDSQPIGSVTANNSPCNEVRRRSFFAVVLVLCTASLTILGEGHSVGSSEQNNQSIHRIHTLAHTHTHTHTHAFR